MVVDNAAADVVDVDYDWSSNHYSSWSESQWPVDAFQVRIFLMPSYQQQVSSVFRLFIASSGLFCHHPDYELFVTSHLQCRVVLRDCYFCF